MQQRQLRLGDILDDYCPRERRVTNHAVVAMVGPDVKQTRCTTCEADHEYKHAKVPRQRRKSDSPSALYSQVLAGGPKRVEAGSPRTDEPEPVQAEEDMIEQDEQDAPTQEPETITAEAASDADADADVEEDVETGEAEVEEGPVHRPLIRATLPRAEGQPPPQRPAPDFTIRQPGGRPNRFRPRHGGVGGGRGGQQFQGNRSNGSAPGGPHRGGMSRPGGGRPPMSRVANRQGGRKRSK